MITRRGYCGVREVVDCLVVGAGVVGLAIARQLSISGRNVIVVEAEPSIGTGISSRNSQVIHGGIYYHPNSLKASLCIQGSKILYAYCQDRNISHQKLGKLIVATAPNQQKTLEQLEKRGIQNGTQGLRMLSPSQALQLEPHLHCSQALWSPCTGILDVHSLMLSLQADAEEQGVTFAFNTKVERVDSNSGIKSVYVKDTCSEDAQMVLEANTVINAAGLHAQTIARSIEGLRQDSIPKAYYAKGNYFSLSGLSSPFSRLIYPVPEEGGLGIHLTLDLAGKARFGPDVQWIKEDEITDYSVDEKRADVFYAEIRKYYRVLPENCLIPDYAGIRPKLYGPNAAAGTAAAADFVIQGKESHGIEGLLNLFGIESPGLTASMAIAELLARGLKQRRY